jgi:hypothetical protein
MVSLREIIPTHPNSGSATFTMKCPHVVDGLLPKSDGYVGICKFCGDQVTVREFSSQTIVTEKVRSLLESWVSMQLLDLIDPGVVDLDDIIRHVNSLHKMIDLNLEELELAKERLDLLKRGIMSSINDDGMGTDI